LSFAFAVAEIFLLLSAVTYVTVEWNLYSVWAGIMLAFFLHLIVHIVQYAAYRRYTPAILTSVLGSVYCLNALYAMSAWSDLLWSQVVFWTLLMVLAGVSNLLVVIRLAMHFEKYLEGEIPLTDQERL
jgi:hypothetical protein